MLVIIYVFLLNLKKFIVFIKIFELDGFFIVSGFQSLYLILGRVFCFVEGFLGVWILGREVFVVRFNGLGIRFGFYF